MFFNTLLMRGATLTYPVLYIGKSSSASYFKTYDGINWTTSSYNNTSPAVTAGKDGLWLRYGGSGVIARSYNYTSWATFTSPFGGVGQDLTFNHSYFLLYKLATNATSISTDSITWTPGTLPASGSWLTPVWNGSYWLAVLPSSTTAAKSTDGVNWSAVTLPSSNVWKAPIWNGSYWHIISDTGTTSDGAISTDGVNWTATTNTMSGGTSLWSTLQWTGTAWWSYDHSITPYKVARTYDGINWSTTTTPWNSNYTIQILNKTGFLLADAGLNSAAIGTNTVSISNDYGVNWSTPVTMTTGYVWDASGYVNGFYYKFALQVSGTIRLLSTSTDGITWTDHTLPVAIAAISSLYYWSGTYYMLEGTSNTLSTTTDLINWTRTTLSLSGPWRSIQEPTHT